MTAEAIALTNGGIWSLGSGRKRAGASSVYSQIIQLREEKRALGATLRLSSASQRCLTNKTEVLWL